MKFDVFISYSSADQKTAEGICDYLERMGYRCFVAYRDIPEGVVWATVITEAIDDSIMMVVVFSHAFNISPHTNREIELASENKMPILTYRIADDEMTGAKKYYLKNLNWINAFPNVEDHFGKLLASVKRLIGEGHNANREEEIQQLRRKAMQGDAEAMCSLALLLQSGDGVEKDLDKAFELYLKAAEKGCDRAMEEVASCYYLGKNEWSNCPRNYHKAAKWLRLLADKGSLKALHNLACLYRFGCNREEDQELWGTTEDVFPIDISKAFELFSEAAGQGHSPSMVALGDLYRHGTIEGGMGKAIEWYEKAMRCGNFDAAFELGKIYFEGVDRLDVGYVAPDRQKAKACFKKALEFCDGDLERKWVMEMLDVIRD